MRKRTMGIIGGLALVVVLGGVSALLLMTDTEDSSSEDSTTEESSGTEIALTEQEPNDVVSIDVTNESGSYTIVRTEEGDDETNATFAVSGWESLPSKTSTLWTLPNNTASLSTSDLIEEDCTDLEKFGLDEDTAVQVTLYFEDGTDYSFRIGNTAADTTYTYLAPADEDTVYTVKSSYLTNFQNAAIDFLDTTILEEPDDDDYPTVNYLKIERTDKDYVFELDYDETADDEDYTGGTVATHVMVSPVPAYLSPDRSTSVVTGMFGLTADSIVAPLPTEEEMEEYGLAEPLGTVTMDCDDGNCYVLYFSESYTVKDTENNTEGTYYYIYFEGIDIIYSIAEEDLVWATVEPTDVASTLILATYVWDVGTLEVSLTDGESFSFTAEGTDADDTVATLNGETTDTERYRQFYAFLLNTKADTIDFTSEPTGEPLAEIYIETQDGSFSRDLVFYELDTYTCLITIDGQAAYTCRKSFLDTLASNMEIYEDTDTDFTTNWS